MNIEEINLFEKITGQIEALHTEITILSKKKPNDAVNEFKLNRINKVLEIANTMLINEYKPFDDFNLFDEDDLPTNSDVTLILSQYLNNLEILRSDNIKLNGSWYWIIDNNESDIMTKPPKKLRYK